MALISMTEYDSASPEVKAEYDDQIAKHGRITNMKRAMLHNIPTFKAYMEWYTLYDLIVPFLGERALTLFSYAISHGNDCLICSIFFRKILIDSGDDPDNPQLNDVEKLMMAFGQSICTQPHDIPDEIYAELKSKFNDEQLTLLVGFAGIMYATNLFNTVSKVPLDEVLYKYVKKEDQEDE
jgi:alkylhydroperoxidase family enzyme